MRNGNRTCPNRILTATFDLGKSFWAPCPKKSEINQKSQVLNFRIPPVFFFGGGATPIPSDPSHVKTYRGPVVCLVANLLCEPSDPLAARRRLG